ncbi:MAG: DUF2939 domain-containing protein [Nitrospinae bacterium]|nr:DUF2939 domain-containing protein [Nitrospinota bacterium]
MRKFLITAVALVSCYVLWPYLVMFNLYVALETADTAGVEKRIAWGPFKKGLRKDLDQLVAEKLKKELKKEGIQISFDSLTLAKEISDQIGTPEGLIYLFHKPEEFIGQIRQIFKSKISPRQIKPPVPQKKPYAPKGPNIPRLYERIDYVFFTGLSSFRLSFKKGNLPFTLDWRRQGISWKLIRLELPVDLIGP